MISIDDFLFVTALLLLLRLEAVRLGLTPEEEEARQEAAEDDELMKIIVIEMVRDNDNCRSYFPWSRKSDGIYVPTERHCDHACNLISDLYLINGGGDNKTRITAGGKCKNSWTVFKRCMCRLKDHTMKKYQWRTIGWIVKRYLAPVMVKYLNHTSTFKPPEITIIDPYHAKDKSYEESTDPYKEFWH